MEKSLVSFITWDEDLVKIGIIGIKNKENEIYSIFKILSEKKIVIDMLLQLVEKDNSRNILFTTSKLDGERTIRYLEENKNIIGHQVISKNENLCKVSIIHDGISTNTEMIFLIFETLQKENINIYMTATCQLKMSIVIEQADLHKAVNLLHEKINLKKE